MSQILNPHISTSTMERTVDFILRRQANRVATENGFLRDFSAWNNTSKYAPHQGKRECARRRGDSVPSRRGK